MSNPIFRTSALLAPLSDGRAREEAGESKLRNALPPGASLGRNQNRRRFAAVEPIDDIGRIEGPASAALVGRDEPQHSDRPGDVGDAAKRHLYRLAGEDDRMAGPRAGQGEVGIDVGAEDLAPTPEIPGGRRSCSLAGAELEVDKGRIIWSVQTHIEREQDQERCFGGKRSAQPAIFEVRRDGAGDRLVMAGTAVER